MRINKRYTRHPGSLYIVLKKIGFYNKINIKNTSKYITKKYDTPTELWKKWQIDVKFVPNKRKCSNLLKNLRFYQWTYID